MNVSIRKLSLGLTALLAIGFAIPQAQAGILLEPYLSYHTGKDSGPPDESVSGVAYGGRVGYSQMGLAAGLDFMQGNWTESATPSVEVNPSDLGVFVAYAFPVMLRVYGVYNFQSNAGIKVGGFSDKYKGTGYKLGVGITTLPMIAVNLEYRASTFTKHDGGSLTPEKDQKTFGLSISVPFDL